MATSMCVLAMNDDNDIILDSTGNLKFYTELADIVRQRIICRLSLFKGQAWLNPSIGVPYLTKINVKNPNLSLIRSLFVTIISGIPNVSKISELTLTYNGSKRTLNVYFKVVCSDDSTAEGEV